MLQVCIILFGIVAVVCGIKALASGEIRVSSGSETRVRGRAARIVGAVSVLIGIVSTVGGLNTGHGSNMVFEEWYYKVTGEPILPDFTDPMGRHTEDSDRERQFLDEKPEHRASSNIPQPATDTKWYDASAEAITRGDVRVRILSAWIGRVQCTQPSGRMARSPTDNLQIAVEIENLHPDKAKSYTGWCTLGATLKITDNRSGLYAQWLPPFEAMINGQTEQGSIPPAESIEDLLAFGPPQIDEKLKYVRIELPAAAFGEQGTLRFEIPAEWTDNVHKLWVDPMPPAGAPTPLPDRSVVLDPDPEPHAPVMPPPPDPNEKGDS